MEVDVPLKNEDENSIPLAQEPNEPEQQNDIVEIEQLDNVPPEEAIVTEDGKPFYLFEDLYPGTFLVLLNLIFVNMKIKILFYFSVNFSSQITMYRVYVKLYNEHPVLYFKDKRFPILIFCFIFLCRN